MKTALFRSDRQTVMEEVLRARKKDADECAALARRHEMDRVYLYQCGRANAYRDILRIIEAQQ